MKVTVVRKIETEVIEAPDGKDYYRERDISSHNFGIARLGEEPLQVVQGTETTYQLRRVRHVGGTENFYVKIDDSAIFNKLINVSLQTVEDEVRKRVERYSENFYTYDLPQIQNMARLEAEARVMQLPFFKKLRLVFGF